MESSGMLDKQPQPTNKKTIGLGKTEGGGRLKKNVLSSCNGFISEL
jgi:hypothetical protein